MPITWSPTSLSTHARVRSRILLVTVKKRLINRLNSEGLSFSARLVEPLTSANSRVSSISAHADVLTCGHLALVTELGRQSRGSPTDQTHWRRAETVEWGVTKLVTRVRREKPEYVTHLTERHVQTVPGQQGPPPSFRRHLVGHASPQLHPNASEHGHGDDTTREGHLPV